MDESALRAELVERCREMNRSGINQGMSGNLSARAGDGFLITPSAVPYDRLTPEMLVPMRFDGTWDGGLKPSSEWRFHLDILRARPEVGAVLHAHPPFCTAVAIHGLDIPAIHYMVAVAGGDSIRCAPYATFGTQALSDHALQALDGRMACLLANHGLIAAGADLAAALVLAVEVETLAAQYCRALAIGAPKLLSKAEMKRVLAKFGAGYGYASAPERGAPKQRAAASKKQNRRSRRLSAG